MRIVDEKLVVKVNSRNKKHFIDRGYSNIKPGDNLTIKPIDLMKGSTNRVNVLCDVCDGLSNIAWSWYYKSFTENGKYLSPYTFYKSQNVETVNL